MKIKCLLMTALILAAGSIGFAQSKTMEIKVYLVAYGDNGKTGEKFGCEDSLVPVTRTIKATPAPLKSAIEELLAMPFKYSETLSNHWGEQDLKLKSISIKKGTATINFTGQGPAVAGICDEPRIVRQITATAMQFPTVKKVKVFVNKQALEKVIS
jgi:spore germination protein GerM